MILLNYFVQSRCCLGYNLTQTANCSGWKGCVLNSEQNNVLAMAAE